MRYYYSKVKIRVEIYDPKMADVNALLSCLNLEPKRWDTWHCGPLDIHEALSMTDSLTTPYEPPEHEVDPWTAQQHLQRIRYLMIQKDPLPITIYFGPDGPEIVDGNHRLAAAYLRGDEYIAICTVGDDTDYTQE